MICVRCSLRRTSTSTCLLSACHSRTVTVIVGVPVDSTPPPPPALPALLALLALALRSRRSCVLVPATAPSLLRLLPLLLAAGVACRGRASVTITCSVTTSMMPTSTSYVRESASAGEESAAPCPRHRTPRELPRPPKQRAAHSPP
ncbi:hypothetical protein FOA52_000625 [Chlamydomonas sp. UWO 241]|nr:hypothetical protein FOA52_000625 [Chlamydomonas sp. UWO 241]